MRFIISLTIILTFGCNLLFSQLIPDPPPRPAEKKSNISDVVSILLEKPAWLYPADTCPAELMPKTEEKINYLDEGCADNPLRCLAKCKNDDGNACYSLALLLQKEQGIEKEYNEALFLRACKLGIASGCTNRAAGMLNLDIANQKIHKCVADTFEKTCAMNDSWGCAMYGLVLIEGIGREINLTEAKKYLKKACEINEGEGEACESALEMEKRVDELLKNPDNLIKF